MSRINTNVAAIQALGRLRQNNDDLAVRLERLSTGLRINRGKDDPAGLIASETLRGEIHGIQQSIVNSTRALNVINTAEGSLNEVSSLLLNIRDLLVSTANEGALTSEEVSANQLEIDNLLSSIDRIANNTTFGGKKLIDGSRAYALSSLNVAAGGGTVNDIAAVSVYSARVPENGTRAVVVQVTASAETAQVSFAGGGPLGGASVTSATTVEIAGKTGTEILSFANSATMSEIKTAINDIKNVTGVSAIVVTTADGASPSALQINSTTYGTDSFVTVKAISGDFIVAGNNGSTTTDAGVDAGVLINGQQASSSGLRADLRSGGLDLRVYLTPTFAQIASQSSFNITGGGSTFQLTADVTPVGQVSVGFDSASTANLGNAVVGYLSTLKSGGTNQVSQGNYIAAQGILDEAINQVAVFRGRLGSLSKNQLETNINSQQISLENVTSSESAVRDADIAHEVAALTRSQILVQSTQSVLQIAVNAPSAVLSLLG